MIDAFEIEDLKDYLEANDEGSPRIARSFLEDVVSISEKLGNFRDAISTNEEIQQYRAIGTIAECLDAMKKQKPENPHTYMASDGIERSGCPRCHREDGRNEVLYAGQKYCSVCGQAIGE